VPDFRTSIGTDKGDAIIMTSIQTVYAIWRRPVVSVRVVACLNRGRSDCGTALDGLHVVPDAHEARASHRNYTRTYVLNLAYRHSKILNLVL
jgi:hypothetical protein